MLPFVHWHCSHFTDALRTLQPFHWCPLYTAAISRLPFVHCSRFTDVLCTPQPFHCYALFARGPLQRCCRWYTGPVSGYNCNSNLIFTRSGTTKAKVIRSRTTKVNVNAPAPRKSQSSAPAAPKSNKVIMNKITLTLLSCTLDNYHRHSLWQCCHITCDIFWICLLSSVKYNFLDVYKLIIFAMLNQKCVI